MAALKSQGAGLFHGSGASPQVYSEVPDVESISGPSGSAAVIPTTALDSTAVEKIMGLPDEGQVQCSLIWGGETSNAVQVGLRTARAAQSLEQFEIRLTDSPETRYAFQGYITNWELSLGVDDVTKVSITIEVTGAVTSV